MRAFVVIFRLLPFVLAFLRDRRRWIVLGAPARRTVFRVSTPGIGGVFLTRPSPEPLAPSPKLLWPV